MNDRGSGGWARWGGVALLVVVAAFFSFMNAGERVTLHVGFTVIYRISLVGLVFAAFLLGMITMFLFGLYHDRRIRSALREQEARRAAAERYAYEPPPEPPI